MPSMEDPMLLILRAQQANVGRIATGLTLPGTTGDGSAVTLFGPAPDIIRLYDTPLRFVQDAKLSGWERIVTLYPAGDRRGARFTNRTDRQLEYHVQFLVRLTEPEQQADRAAAVGPDGLSTSNPLAEKVHRLRQDFHYVFHDNHQLVTAECPTGLIDWQNYDIDWDTELVAWPEALFTAKIVGERSAW